MEKRGVNLTVKNNERKNELEDEVAYNNRIERNRIFSYRRLRISEQIQSIEQFYQYRYQKGEYKYKAENYPAIPSVLKTANIRIIDLAKSVFSEVERKRIKASYQETCKKMHEDVDKANQMARIRCDKLNKKLSDKLEGRKKALRLGSPLEIKKYYEWVFSCDVFSIDGETQYGGIPIIKYFREQKRLVVDYRLPSVTEVPRTKEWKLNSKLEISKVNFSDKEYLRLYETMIFDLTIRAVRLIFLSDNCGVIDEIVFNGFCEYIDGTDEPIFLLSILVKSKDFSNRVIEKLDFVSKKACSACENTVYIGDIGAENPPKELLNNPPLKQIVPIQTNFHY